MKKSSNRIKRIFYSIMHILKCLIFKGFGTVMNYEVKEIDDTMNQFDSLEGMMNEIGYVYDMAVHLDYILNNIWSTYSFQNGMSRWRTIESQIDDPYRRKISTELNHVELGHGREQALMATKSEMEKYLAYLIKNNE